MVSAACRDPCILACRHAFAHEVNFNHPLTHPPNRARIHTATQKDPYLENIPTVNKDTFFQVCTDLLHERNPDLNMFECMHDCEHTEREMNSCAAGMASHTRVLQLATPSIKPEHKSRNNRFKFKFEINSMINFCLCPCNTYPTF